MFHLSLGDHVEGLRIAIVVNPLQETNLDAAQYLKTTESNVVKG